MHFHDRFEAGQILAEKLQHYRDRPDVLVLALPRGGVPVAFEIARSLNAPLDVFLVRKVGVPGHEELAMGAVANRNIRVSNQDVVQRLGISEAVFDEVADREHHELRRRRDLYRGGEPPLQVADHTIILVDDGLATGSTMRAAIAALREQRPSRLVVAVPVGASETCANLGQEVDEIVCGACPEQFTAVGAWYDDFSPTSDETVTHLLAKAAERRHVSSRPP